MARWTMRHGSLTGIVLAAGCLAPALCFQGIAQAGAPSVAVARAPADPAETVARTAFEALPEADRKAVQEALVWTGDYSGVTDGAFGRGTFAAIKAYQRRKKAGNDGVLTPMARALLLAEGARAREAVGFTVIDDPATGMRIGVPQRLLGLRAKGAAGSIFKGRAGGVSLETFASAPTADLAALYQAALSGGGRKASYKLLRPDFYVIAGEAAGKRFYTRAALGAPGVRGFTFTYPRRPELDRIAIAIANSFVPFPAASPARPTVAVVPPPLPKPVIHLTGIAISGKDVLTVSLPESCTLPTSGGAPLKVKRVEQAAGLTLLERGADAGRSEPLALRAVDLKEGDGLVVLSAAGAGAANVVVAAGEARSPVRVTAPLQAPSGSLVFDRDGALAGIVTFQGRIKALPGGIVPAASYTLAPAAAMRPLLPVGSGGPPNPAGDASAGTIAARYGHAVVAVTCGG